MQYLLKFNYMWKFSEMSPLATSLDISWCAPMHSLFCTNDTQPHGFIALMSRTFYFSLANLTHPHPQCRIIASISWASSGSVNTLRPRQNGRHFQDDTFKPIFFNENIRISIKISLKFVPKVPINNISSLVQIMAWRRPGDKPLSEPIMVCLLTHICVTRPQWVNGFSPVRRQGITWTNTDLLLIGPLWTHFGEIWSKNCIFFS